MQSPLDPVPRTMTRSRTEPSSAPASLPRSAVDPAASDVPGPSHAAPPATGRISPSRGARAAVETAVGRRLLAQVPDAPFALELPSGVVVQAGTRPRARVVFRDFGALLGLLGPDGDLHFGDAYAAGRIEIEGDLLDVLEPVFAAPPPVGAWARAGDTWRRLRRRRNSLRGSREHVHHHYDLGNDFYALWLDREMVYTCAYFPRPDASLEEAQVAKMEHVARKLRLRAGERVVEAGCGWGSLALHMARHHGVHVRAFNISREQVAWARARARAEGLEGRVEFVEDDYRNVSGRFDAFVSVGMLEHVGPEHYRDLGGVIDRTLAPGGRGLLHFIGRHRRAAFSPWVERRIFPGAYAPTLREAGEVLEAADLAVVDVENLRPHYARTLERWLDRFESHRDTVRARFDERFVRTWRLYLAGSVVAFRTGSLQLFQVLFGRPRSEWLPWTRADLYTDQ
jgi:cyclopropane-fatty-acyl-phospholipid synthase